MFFSQKRKSKKYLLLTTIYGLSCFSLSSCLFNLSKTTKGGEKQPIVRYKKWEKQQLPTKFFQSATTTSFYQKNKQEPWNGAFFNSSRVKNEAFIQQQLTSLSQNDLVSDLKSSLYELTNLYPQLSIDFPSLKITLAKEGTNISDFFLSCKLTNSGNSVVNIFNGIGIMGQSSAKLVIRLEQGFLTPLAKEVLSQKPRWNTAHLGWDLLPSRGKFMVQVSYFAGQHQGYTKTFTPSQLKLITSRSYQINTNLINVIKEQDNYSIKQLTHKLISKISNEDLKKDINDWFLTYLRYQFFLLYRDLTLIFKYISQNNYYDKNAGTNISLLQALSKSGAQSNQILKNFNLNSPWKELVGIFLSQKNDGSASNYHDFINFIQFLQSLNLEEIFNKQLTLKIIWFQDPKLNIIDENNPTVSFSFALEVIFKNDINLPLKGKDFDLSQYLGIDKFIRHFISDPSTLVKTFLDGLKRYFNFDKLAIKKGQFLTLRFDARNSPIIFNDQSPFDYAWSLQKSFGLKFANVSMSLNLWGMRDFLFSFLEKINQVTWTDIESIWAFKSFITDRVLKNATLEDYLKALDYFMVTTEERKKVHLPKNKRKPRPLEIIFDSFFNQTFNFNSFQFNIFLTRAFHYLPDTFQGQPLWKKYYDHKMQPHLTKDDVTDSDTFDVAFPKVKYSTYLYLPRRGAINDAYYANPDLDLHSLLPYQANHVQYYDPKQVSASQLQNFDQLNYVFKNQTLKNIFENQVMNSFDKSYTFFNSHQFNLDFKQTLKDHTLANDTAISTLKQDLDQLLAKHFTNPHPSYPIVPEISLVRLPVEATVKSLIQKRNLEGFLNNINTDYMFSDGFFQRDPYLVFVNLKTGFDFSSLVNQTTINSNFPISWFLTFIPPRFDQSKFQCPSILGFKVC